MKQQFELKPSYKVSFFGVRCFYRVDGNVLWGINSFYDNLIPAAVFFHNIMSSITGFLIPGWQSPGFPFRILDVYCDDI